MWILQLNIHKHTYIYTHTEGEQIIKDKKCVIKQGGYPHAINREKECWIDRLD